MTSKKKQTGQKNKKKKTGDCKIIINSEAPEECRIALIDKGKLEAFDIATQAHEQTRGNIYLGKIQNIEKSLEAVFVDIGRKKNAYLPFTEIHPDYTGNPENKKQAPQLLEKGQPLLVQIVKEETSMKGPFATTYLSIPGRYLVLMPGNTHVGVSRKIEDEQERKRLKEILKSCKVPEGVGLIARTVSAGIPKRDILKDLRYLVRLWNNLKGKVQSTKTPGVIYEDADVVTRFLRDQLTTDISEIVVDNEAVFNNIKAFLRIIAPRQVATVKLYKKDQPIFTAYGLEEQIEQVYTSMVHLPSGGHIVIEPTEAMISIDVNSGRNVNEKDIEDTALKNNLEAAEEIARQLRLRDLGGIIVIDFIDMRSRQNRTQVERRMRECLKKDRARTEVTRISRFGLLALVRQKIRAPVQTGSYIKCPCCNGRGLVKSVEAVSLSHMRKITSFLAKKKPKPGQTVRMEVPPPVASYLLNKKRYSLHTIETDFQTILEIEANPVLGVEDFKLYALPQGNGRANGKARKGREDKGKKNRQQG